MAHAQAAPPEAAGNQKGRRRSKKAEGGKRRKAAEHKCRQRKGGLEKSVQRVHALATERSGGERERRRGSGLSGGGESVQHTTDAQGGKKPKKDNDPMSEVEPKQV